MAGLQALLLLAGLQVALLPPCPDRPNCVSSQAGGSHAIPPLTFRGDPGQAFERLRSLLAGRSDTTIIAAGQSLIRVEFRTPLGFVDEGRFVLDAEGRRIDLRSASRLGYWDLGKNRRRIEDIRQAFEKGGP